MLQTPQNTIIRQKYNKITINQSNNSIIKNQKSLQEQYQCFTPVLKTNILETQISDTLRKTDRIQPIATKFYDLYLKNNINSFDPIQDQDKILKSLKNEQKQYLYINSPFQSYSSPIDNNNPECLFLNNVQTLKYHLNRAKQQSDKLKDENRKLRTQKIKLIAKSPNNQYLKLIPLKIEFQNLKKNIQKLAHQKQILEISLKKKMKDQKQTNNLNSYQVKHFKKSSQNKIDQLKSNKQSHQRLENRKFEQFTTPRKDPTQYSQNSTFVSGYTNNSSSDSRLIQNNNNYNKNDNNFSISNNQANYNYSQQKQQDKNSPLNLYSPASEKSKYVINNQNLYSGGNYQINQIQNVNNRVFSDSIQQNNYSNISHMTNNREFINKGNQSSVNKNTSYSGSSLKNTNKRPILYKNQHLQYCSAYTPIKNQLQNNYNQQTYFYKKDSQINPNIPKERYNNNSNYINNGSNVHSPRNK